ncbi:MAG: hypothetical protein FJZ90_01395 [Chloroflexi bacterium]|nr:hypothetical protein [Chloroflexota bacterium]
MALVRTGFRAEDNGFRFVNYYDFAFEFDLPLIGPIDLGQVIYGLCGGMCYAALDYFHAGLPVLEVSSQPEIGTALYAYLWARQLRSLSLPVVPLKIMEWMLRGDDDVAHLTAKHEFSRVESRVARGNPAVICVIRAGGLTNPTLNHQVVVVGYDLKEATGDLTLYLYDPNYPGRETQIGMRLPSRRGQLTAQEVGLYQSTGEPLRGFFVLDYRARSRGLPATPDQALALA